MRTLHTLILLALLSAAKPINAKGTDAATKEMVVMQKTKSVNLEIKGLFKELKQDWYIPDTHIIYLNLVPNGSDKMKIDTVETNNQNLQKMLLQYFEATQVNVKSEQPIRVRVLLTN